MPHIDAVHGVEVDQPPKAASYVTSTLSECRVTGKVTVYTWLVLDMVIFHSYVSVNKPTIYIYT